MKKSLVKLFSRRAGHWLFAFLIINGMAAGTVHAQTPAARPPSATAAPAPVAGDEDMPSLKVGDPAPPLTVEKWIKGKPVSKFVPGHIYVIEFWATWCGPCRAVMPHLSEMAARYKDKVTIIGFNVLEISAGKNKSGDYVTKVANFVKNLGDGMDYTVAADVREETTYKEWMTAAGMGGIPSSFIVDGNGKIAWWGHPMVLEDALELVMDGQMTPTKRMSLWQEFKAKNEKRMALAEQMQQLKKAGDNAKALQLADQLIAETIMGKSPFVIAKYELLKSTDPAKAKAYGNEILKTFANDPLTLQDVARTIINNEDAADKALALGIMEQAIQRCAPDDPFAYSTLAGIYFKNGDHKKAVSTQQYVVKLLEDTSLVEQRQEIKDKAREDLAKYKAGK
ncbi:TlpA disulfide reductase family protein [Chitinophaga sp. XS-30]|uniref:TlpA disulfide reductase family protein n=1 Tax=Chitinophaga sp. XS-30 TaxID=2604421 RepID=UPI0011DC74BE|nr:TlpA disulfide reductase family protein [Chitinophaga sp. XS-30]QEH41639.1 TlpA family protein disulfide reductase [Chitinophaga sp. XS-30]